MLPCHFLAPSQSIFHVSSPAIFFKKPNQSPHRQTNLSPPKTSLSTHQTLKLTTMPSLPCYRSSSKRWRRGKGLRLHQPRLSLHRLRFQFFELVNLLNRWKFVCCKAMESLKKSKGWKSSRARRRGCNQEDIDDERVRHSLTDYKLISYGRSNSFYAEAIAECLEFIKRNSVSSEESALVN